MAAWELTPELIEWVRCLVWMLDARVRPRIGPLLVGALFAQSRRTVSRWIVAAGLSDQFKRYYYALGTVGRKSNDVASCLVGLVRRVVPLPERILLAIDDTLTKRYGPHVQGAGIHHNPTPGPADARLAYGHVWVTLAWVVRQPRRPSHADKRNALRRTCLRETFSARLATQHLRRKISRLVEQLASLVC